MSRGTWFLLLEVVLVERVQIDRTRRLKVGIVSRRRKVRRRGSRLRFDSGLLRFGVVGFWWWLELDFGRFGSVGDGSRGNHRFEGSGWDSRS